jgi:hypothetical protein
LFFISEESLLKDESPTKDAHLSERAKTCLDVRKVPSMPGWIVVRCANSWDVFEIIHSSKYLVIK